MTYNELINVVKTILEEGDAGLQVVYPTLPETLEVYPCCTISPVGHSNSFASLRDNERLYTLSIKIFANLQDITEDTQLKLREITDNVVNVLEKQANLNLDGVVDWSNPSQAKFEFLNTPGRIYMSEITFQVHGRFNRWN